MSLARVEEVAVVWSGLEQKKCFYEHSGWSLDGVLCLGDVGQICR